MCAIGTLINTLYKYRTDYLREKSMTEVELNALFNICPERVENVYTTNTIKDVQEIQRIINVFKIAKEQRETSKSISSRALAAFGTILISNN